MKFLIILLGMVWTCVAYAGDNRPINSQWWRFSKPNQTWAAVQSGEEKQYLTVQCDREGLGNPIFTLNVKSDIEIDTYENYYVFLENYQISIDIGTSYRDKINVIPQQVVLTEEHKLVYRLYYQPENEKVFKRLIELIQGATRPIQVQVTGNSRISHPPMAMGLYTFSARESRSTINTIIYDCYGK